MTTASAYLLNNFPNTERWHLKSMACQYKYFSGEGIRLNVLDKNHYLIKPMLDKPIFPLCRKIIRLYDFLNSGDDYGVFIDLDTVVINGKKSIHDFCVDGQSYIRSSSPYPRFKGVGWEDLPEYLKKRECIHLVLKNGLSLDYGISYTVNTGFTLLSREFCEIIANRLEEFDLTLTKKSGMDNYIEFDSAVQKLYSDRGWPIHVPTIHDEHLFEIALNSADEQNNPIKRAKSTKDICTEGNEIRLPLAMFATGHVPEQSNCLFDMPALAKKDSIFLHLMRRGSHYDLDTLDGIFKVAGDL